MHTETIELLHDLNREFYQSFAEPFAESRSRPQPGVASYLAAVGHAAPVLDLGCGSGSLANELDSLGHRGPYTGADSSSALLRWARQHVEHDCAQFTMLDLAEPGWSGSLDPPYPWVFALGLIHHLPGAGRRRAWAAELGSMLPADGQVLVSVWNFTSEPRFLDRVVPWSRVGLGSDDIEQGDYLLDWRRGGRGLRYVHLLDEAELSELASAAGCQPVSVSYAGGTAGRLNLLQLWRARIASD
ncbi:MAG: class I SAM-dependent methyltransferase [Anaerolineales bacterium]